MVVIFVTYLVSRLLLKLWELYDRKRRLSTVWQILIFLRG